MKLDQIKTLKPKLRAKTTLQLLLDDDSFELVIPNYEGANTVDLLFQLKNKSADYHELQEFNSRMNKYKVLLQNLGLKVSMEITSDRTSSKFWITGTCESIFNLIEEYFEKNPQLSAPRVQAKTTLQLLLDDDSFELIVPNDPRANSVNLISMLKSKNADHYDRQLFKARIYKHKELLENLGLNVCVDSGNGEQFSKLWITGRCPDIFTILEEHFEKNPQLSAPRVQAKSALQLLLDDDSFEFFIPDYAGANTVDILFSSKSNNAEYHEQQAFQSRMYKFKEILNSLDLKVSHEIFSDKISAKFWITGDCQTVIDALNRHNCNISTQNLIKAVERLKVSCAAVSAVVSKPNDTAVVNTATKETSSGVKAGKDNNGNPNNSNTSRLVSNATVTSPIFSVAPTSAYLKPPAPTAQGTSRVTAYQPKR